MKKYIAALAVAVLMSVATPAEASEQGSIVIIDTGFDSSVLGENVIQEVCVTVYSGCNDGSNLQVGPGASGSLVNVRSSYLSDWNHGQAMAQAAIEINPSIKLILIRNSKVYSNGNVLAGGENSVELALQWVLDNADEYSIIGVSMSRGTHSYIINQKSIRTQLIYAQLYNKNLKAMASNPRLYARSIIAFTKKIDSTRAKLAAMPDISCPASPQLSSLVTQLAQRNIASMFATGNDYDSRYVDSPACIDDAIAVTASDSNGKVLEISNVAPNTDFAVEAANTSTATAKFAARWSLVYNGSYNSTYNSIANSGTDSHSWSAIFVR